MFLYGKYGSKVSHELISPLLKISVINGAAVIASYVPWWEFKSQDSGDDNGLLSLSAAIKELRKINYSKVVNKSELEGVISMTTRN